MKWIVLAILSCCLVFWLRQRNRNPPSQARNVRRALPGGDDRNGAFKAVSIRPGRGACAAAKALNGTRYLQAEAPAMPLAGCTAAKCDCHYSYHTDRRADEDRRAPYSIRTDLYGSADQADRRKAARDRRRQ